MAFWLAQATLLSQAALGTYCLHIFNGINGFFDMLSGLVAKNVLPDGITPLPESFTGVQAVDDFLKFMLLFFWPTVDGQHPKLSLSCFLFASQCVATLTINLVEGMRDGNKGRVVSVTTVYSVLVQTLGFAVMGPLYLALHLFTSPTATHPTPANLSLDEGFLTGIPFGLVIGFIAPTVYMALPSPSLIAFDQKVLAVLFWQGSPIYAGLYASIWQTLLWPKIKYADEAQARKNQILLLRYVYKFGVAVAAVGHIATMTLTVTALALPKMFSPSVVALIQPRQMFVPVDAFDTTVRVASVEQGCLYFIQFDYYISGAAYLYWAITLRYTGLRESFDFEAIVSLFTRTILLGPMAAALTYIWDRDEAVIGGNGEVAVPDSVKKIL